MKRYFISGVLVVVPFILTFIVLRFLFETVDGILGPVLHNLLGFYRFGLGVVATLLLVLLAGVLTRNFVGARIYKEGEKLLVRFPLVRPIYFASKQLLEGLAGETAPSFKEVALIEYPRTGLYSLCFVTSRPQLTTGSGTRQFSVCFVPTTPTPISGFAILLPSEEVKLVNLTVEEALKYLVSGGVATPEFIKVGEGRSVASQGEVKK